MSAKDWVIEIVFGFVNLLIATALFMLGFDRLHDMIPSVPALGYWQVFSITVWFGLGVMFVKNWLFTRLTD